ncbi:uncharacterized protein [Chironomus tepperi]|uniref:uncharacterized protein n=1 Tax=Chironomus tepperi TaxID=113505 RepID=UPI00391F9D6E
MSDEFYEQGSSSKSDVVNEPQRLAPNILNNTNLIKIDEKFIHKIQKGSKNVTKDVKDSCKVLHFSPEWSFEEVLMKIDGLDPKEYPQIYIFVIDAELNAKNQEEWSSKVANFQQMLHKFGSNRPIILQLKSNEKNELNFFYKEEDSSQFIDIDQTQEAFDDLNHFPSFFCKFLNNKFNNFEEDFPSSLSQLQNRSLILRFVQGLALSESFFGSLILKIAESGTISEFIAALDSPFDSKGSIFSNRSQKYIAVEFKDENSENNDSALFRAVQNKNSEVTYYLITYWTHLIQFNHQVKISTAAFETGQFDVLCDLLDVADFPFPNDFKVDSVDHEGLKSIIAKRRSLTTAISNDDIHNLEEFINENPSLKFVYNVNNKSALKQAVDASNIKFYVFLKFRGFDSKNPNENFDEANGKADKYAVQQRKQNIIEGLVDDQISVNSLCNRSLIHNKRISKEQEKDYRIKIRSWFEDINKINNGKVFLDVAASCDRLKILFDFDNDTVENASITGHTSSGSTYPISKWIFIGAKLTDQDGNQRGQKIKGVLAHELCHYVMKLVYDNDENPYYEHRADLKEMFEAIVLEINRWTAEDAESIDDQCNGIVSTVFTLYNVEDFHAELIVRFVHFSVEFDDRPEQLELIVNTYERLVNYWQNQVIPEMQNYLLRNKEVIKLNRLAEKLNNILKHQIQVNPRKEIEELINSKLVIVTTNHPHLLFIDICKNLKEKSGNLMNSKNFFTEPEKLINPQIWEEFRYICSNNQELGIFVDCTRVVPKSLENIFINKELNFSFVVSNEQQSDELVKICKRKGMKNETRMDINYNWSDLTDESQKLVLKTKINFQNNLEPTLTELILSNHKTEEPTTSTAGNIDKEVIDDLVDDQLLNLLLENLQVQVNTKESDIKSKEHFQFLYQPRDFIKETEIKLEMETENPDSRAETSNDFFDKIWKTFKLNKSKRENLNQKNIEYQDISQEQILWEVENQQYVLISDIAGNGKSWAMKNLTNVLRKRNPKNWVTYVDLKQFIDEFKAQDSEPEFSSFMVDHILKSQKQFEVKIFQKMYKDGKVFILFDGFDEIAPNYAEFVSKLAQNFQHNGGNQLWIATRDYFEVDLKENCKLNVAYSLNNMTEDEGTKLIVNSWILDDLINYKTVPKSRQDFESHVRTSPKYEIYEQKAEQLIQKALISRNNSVGLPQLFKMIAVGFKDEENVVNLQGLKIYIKFIEILYLRWSRGKGQVKEQQYINVQRNFTLKFFNFHQYHAILSFSPKLAKILFPGYDGSEWKDAEIIACGMLTIINGIVYFIHETIREYFVADAIVNALKNQRGNEISSALDKIMIEDKFGIIKNFIFHACNEKEVLKKIETQVKNLVYSNGNFGLFFTQSLENLADFGIEVLKNENYRKTKAVLNENVRAISRGTQNSEMFLKFQDFLLHFFSSQVNDLKELIIQCEVFLGIISSNLDLEIFKNFVIKIEEKTDQKFIRQALMMKSNEIWEENIFYYFAESSNVKEVKKFLEIMDNYLSVNEIFELMKRCHDYTHNIFYVCIDKTESKENLKILWTEIEKYFTDKGVPEKFKELVKRRDYAFDQTVILAAVKCNNMELHQTMWELLLKIIEDRNELMDFLQNDSYNYNFVNELVRSNRNPAIIKWTFQLIKDKLTDAQLREILKSKNWMEMNLLQSAAYESNSDEVLQFLWELFRDFFESDEKFLKMLKEGVGIRKNILHIVAENSSIEVFEFMIQELEKLASIDDIKEMLNNCSKWNRSLLHSASRLNKSLELHQTLWKTFRKYFGYSEILEFINHVDYDGNNLLCIVEKYNRKEIIELTWNEIKSFLTQDEQVEYLKFKLKNPSLDFLKLSLNLSLEIFKQHILDLIY